MAISGHEQDDEEISGVEWFSKATIKRFLHVVGSPDSINVINTIIDEMSRLEDSKTKFHVSLYGKDCQDHLGSGERDGSRSWNGEAPTSIDEVSIVSSDASKNEVLRAKNLRVTALSNKLAETFNKAAYTKFSPKYMTHLLKFSHRFGATNLERSLCKFIELNQISQDVGHLNNETTMLTCDVTNVLHNDISKEFKRSTNI